MVPGAPGDNEGRNYGKMPVEFEFFGKTAHASTNPGQA